MSGQDTAKLFRYEGGQAVRLPEAVEFPGDRVRVRRVGNGVLIEPIPARQPKYATTAEWYAAMDEVGTDESFMADGRNQPPMPPPRDLFDW